MFLDAVITHGVDHADTTALVGAYFNVRVFLKDRVARGIIGSDIRHRFSLFQLTILPQV